MNSIIFLTTDNKQVLFENRKKAADKMIYLYAKLDFEKGMNSFVDLNELHYDEETRSCLDYETIQFIKEFCDRYEMEREEKDMERVSVKAHFQHCGNELLTKLFVASNLLIIEYLAKMLSVYISIKYIEGDLSENYTRPGPDYVTKVVKVNGTFPFSFHDTIDLYDNVKMEVFVGETVYSISGIGGAIQVFKDLLNLGLIHTDLGTCNILCNLFKYKSFGSTLLRMYLMNRVDKEQQDHLFLKAYLLGRNDLVQELLNFG